MVDCLLDDLLVVLLVRGLDVVRDGDGDDHGVAAAGVGGLHLEPAEPLAHHGDKVVGHRLHVEAELAVAAVAEGQEVAARGHQGCVVLAARGLE